MCLTTHGSVSFVFITENPSQDFETNADIFDWIDDDDDNNNSNNNNKR